LKKKTKRKDKSCLALIAAVSFIPVRFLKPDRYKNIAKSRKMVYK
jgi:hypothetical protein